MSHLGHFTIFKEFDWILDGEKRKELEDDREISYEIEFLMEGTKFREKRERNEFHIEKMFTQT